MKICITHLRHAYTGGAERYLNYIAAGLAGRGHEITILCRTHAEPPHPAIKFKSFRGAALGRAHRHWRFARAVERHLQRHGEEYDVVYGLGRTWSQDVLRLGGGSHKTTMRVLGRGDPDASGIKSFFDIKNRSLLALEKRSMAPDSYKKIICNSKLVRDEVMTQYGVPESAIEVIHNGVDLNRFNPQRNAAAGASLRHELGLGHEHIVFLFVGIGFARKGLALLLRSFAAVADSQPQARLLVVGNDSSLQAYRRLADGLGIAGRVLFLGNRPDPEYCLAAADVFVFPTRYDPFANVTVEALASGMPVITTDTNGGAEVIDSEACGTVIPMAQSPQAALRRALRHWYDRDRIQRARPAARACAEQHDIQCKITATEHLLRTVAEGRDASDSARR